jgi:nucleotide-binding universal stress UspA family protein
MPNAQASLRLTFKSILVPVDFTDASVTALAYARAIAEEYGAKTYIAHALNPTPPVFIPMEPIHVEMDVEWQDAQTEFKRFLRENSTNGESAEGILARGVTWNVIQDVVSERSIDLIVLGSHGKHGLKKLVMGSEAEQIFRQADCPVLTIGPNVAPPSHDGIGFKHILFATDFSGGSLRALPYALSLSEENQANLSLLHVIPMVPAQHQKQIAETALEKLRDLIPPETENWYQMAPAVNFEFPAEGILHVAEEQGADLIVMGVHKRAPRTSSHLPWAIAYEVICHAHCPVLTVRG